MASNDGDRREPTATDVARHWGGISYVTLEAELRAAQNADDLPSFILSLEQRTQASPKTYLLRLFLARAYEAAGDPRRALQHLRVLLEHANPSHKHSLSLSREISAFATRHGYQELAEKLRRKGFPHATADERGRPAARSLLSSEAIASGFSALATLAHQEAEGVGAANATRHSTMPAPEFAFDPDRVTRASARPVLLTVHEWGIDYQGLSRSGDERQTKVVPKAARRAAGPVPARLPRPRMPSTMSAAGTRSAELEDSRDPMRLQRQLEDVRAAVRLAERSGDVARLLVHLRRQARLHFQIEQWAEAAAVYELIIARDERQTPLDEDQLQLARIYSAMGNEPRAKRLLDEILLRTPHNALAQQMRESLQNRDGLEAEGRNPGAQLLSPMLHPDLESAQYRDPQILAQGSKPLASDAIRLLNVASRVERLESGDGYPLFLEAAKAFASLPEGSYFSGDFLQALAEYALRKSGALVSEMDRRRAMSTRELHDTREFGRLRDSATSYALEAIRLQRRLQPAYADPVPAILSYMRAQVAYAEAVHRVILPVAADRRTSLAEQLSYLFRACLSQGNEQLAHLVFEAVVACGAAAGRRSLRVLQMRGPRLIVEALRDRESQVVGMQLLARVSGTEFLPSIDPDTQIPLRTEPDDLLQQALQHRRKEWIKLTDFFTEIQKIVSDVSNLRALRERWKRPPTRLGPALDTDLELQQGISDILETLLPFTARSAEERTAILVTARNLTETWLKFVEDYPTYWGRVGFQPLLRRLQHGIRAIEQRRMRDLQPRLRARLEPPLFHLRGDFVEGGLILRNDGRGTAESVRLRIRLASPQERSTSLFKEERELDKEVAAGDSLHHVLRVPRERLSLGLEAIYHLEVRLVPSSRTGEVETHDQEFTLEIESDSSAPLLETEVPWRPVGVPEERLFKGRETLISDTVAHLRSTERFRTNILYGLTRTGKSSLLSYLQKALDLQPVVISGQPRRFLAFDWDFMAANNTASTVKELWQYLVGEQMLNKLKERAERGLVTAEDLPTPIDDNNLNFGTWQRLIEHFVRRQLYPVFLLDEFSYYGYLFKKQLIDPAFLGSIRELAFAGKASFVFAGTYDIRQIIADPAYGITSQLAATIDVRVGPIERQPALELIRVLDPQLRFTEDAEEHILHLSYRIPYFIQLLCWYCAKYAIRQKRRTIGFPEVELVVQSLTGEPHERIPGIERLTVGSFMGNMHFPDDKKEYHALISTICDLRRADRPEQTRLTPYKEIQNVWKTHGVSAEQLSCLAEAVVSLCAREVLIQEDDEGAPAYRISVDLFRRFWTNEHKWLEIELDAMKKGG